MFRFTIRELVLVTLVVAMGIGWWANRRSIVTVANDRFEQEMHLLMKYGKLKRVIEAEGYVVNDFPDEQITLTRASQAQ